MDRFNSLATQAKAKAEQGRIAANSKLDSYQRGRASSGSSGSAAESAAPPAPPARGLPPRSSTASHAGSSSTGGVFVGISDQERKAFFGLLDEYFASRPQYKALFNESASAAAPPAASARRSPVPAPPAAAPSPPPRVRGMGTATALYQFDGQDPAEDLSFDEGDKILVLEHVSEDWWKGEINGRSGIFPASYVQMS